MFGAGGRARARIGGRLSGKIALGNEIISEGESLFTAGFDGHPSGLEASDVVLFLIDTKAEVYRGGMFSGNQRRRFR